MNKYLRAVGLVAILCFSFYYTEQIAHFMQSKDPIYESILASKTEYEKPFINAIVEDSYIIPGISGKVVNVEKSFRNMKNLGYFRESLFVFDEVKPEISLEENLDKIITSGNANKQEVSIIFEEASYIPYFEEMGVNYAFLTTKDFLEEHLEYGLRINHDFSNYDVVEKNLKLKKENTPFCFVTSSNEDFCKKKKKILIQETMKIDRSNFSSQYHTVRAGSILYLQNNLSTTNLNLLLNQIYFKGYQIVSLEELISESRN